MKVGGGYTASRVLPCTASGRPMDIKLEYSKGSYRCTYAKMGVQTRECILAVKKKSKGQRATEETLQSGCMGKRFMECVDEGDLTGHHIRGEVYTI